jgi:hypothetical protein
MIKGHIHRILWNKVKVGNNDILEVGFIIKDLDNKECKIKGHIKINPYPSINDYIEASKTDKIYNNDIHICTYIRIELPIKTEFIYDKILKLSDKLLTKKEATFLIENNKDIWNSIDNKTLSIGKIKQHKIDKIYEKFEYENVCKDDKEKFKNFLARCGIILKNNQINNLIEKYQTSDKIIEIMNNDLIRLLYVNSIGILTLIEIADKLNHSEEQKIKLFIMNDLIQSPNGDTCITYNKLIANILKEKGQKLNNFLNIEQIDNNIKELIRDGLIIRYNDYLYEFTKFNCETNIGESLKNINNNSPYLEDFLENAEDFLENYKGSKLNNEQRESFLSIFKSNINITVGPAGTGKSEILTRLCDFKYNMIYNSLGVLVNGEEIWYKRLQDVKDYIDENGKRPSTIDNEKQIKQLGYWCSDQQINYNKNRYIMKNEQIYNKWIEFINNPKYKIYFQRKEDYWVESFNKVVQYIDDNNKRPSIHNKSHQIKKLGGWIGTQKKSYKKKTEIMSNEIIYGKWTEFINNQKYKKYFQSAKDNWIESFNQLIQYIDINNKRPSNTDKNMQIKQLATWIQHQKPLYITKKGIMLNEIIYSKWTEFINNPKYKKYFQSAEDDWIESLNQVIQYIDINNKRPSNTDKNMQIKQLARWIGIQQKDYVKKKYNMSNEEIYGKWTEFINNQKYNKYMQSIEDNWNNNLQKVIEYIDTNNKRPNLHDIDKKIKHLGSWSTQQLMNYRRKEKNMLNEIIYNKWAEFINNQKYKKYFQSAEDDWIESLNQVIQYIDLNNKKPSDKQLAVWINNQQSNYKKKIEIMSNEIIYDKWTEFINNQKYKKYFQSNEDNWNEKFNLVVKYIDVNNKKPSDKQLAVWIIHQQTNYKKKTEIMSNEIIYDKWIEFINNPQYKKYFQSNDDDWYDTLNQVEQYININKKRPSSRDKNKKIYQLASWIGVQNKNYKNKKQIMSKEIIYNKWTEFLNDSKYKHLFKNDSTEELSYDKNEITTIKL